MTLPIRFGIDVGGSKIEGAAFEGHPMRLLTKERQPTEADKGYAHVLEQILKVYRSLQRQTECANPLLGIGTPGSLSPKTGLMRNSNALCLNDRSFAADLERVLDRPFVLENDANCFALAEARLGAAVGYRLVFGVILGSGCGGGIVWDNRIHAGSNRVAGEWGHTVIDPAGPICYCGRRGCAELYLSGTGIERQYRQLTTVALTAPQIIDRGRQGDVGAKEIIDRFFDTLAVGMANVINTLDPDAIVFGGGLSQWPELYSRGAEAIRSRVFGGYCRTPILSNKLGDSAGVWGAAILTLEEPK